MKSIQPAIRIVIRIIGGVMIGRGWADEGTVNMFEDPAIIGAIALGVNELWYLAATRYGWPT